MVFILKKGGFFIGKRGDIMLVMRLAELPDLIILLARDCIARLEYQTTGIGIKNEKII